MTMIAVIGGTGVYDPDMLEDVREEAISTDYGEVKLTRGSYKGRPVAFMPRHGGDHSVPPHRINYRANIAALHRLGTKRIIATAAVGSLNPEFKPGSIVIVDQFIDFTKSRISTFYEGDERGVIHTDVTEPYCPELRKVLYEVASSMGTDVFDRGTYVCTEGPRFETAAEIRMYKILGGDVVGMTSVPEAVLARELGICYATVAMVTNFAAGISPNKLTHEEVVSFMQSNIARLRKVITMAIERIPQQSGCGCGLVPERIKAKQ
ncbi:MAG: S-methyl-5'-thioadenosine phosphorylase [Syntrophomonadaceae bacterium]|nr:S-methyl-5'-thioadenosine phosphorylase [Syntrophomonadaceae bacterium]